jgi:Sulfotransferase family
VKICEERSLAASWRTLGDRLSRRLWLLQGEALLAEARRATGLEDFGTPPIEPALTILANSLEVEADLHPLGRLFMRLHLRDLLDTRLRLTQVWSGRLKALEASPIQRPVFITGMPRSGSSFLHELLAEDPENRVPRVWEVMFPVPIQNRVRSGVDPRVRKAELSLWWFRRLAPGVDAAYPMRAWTPHECVAIHSYTLLSEEFVSTCRVPAYEAFLRASDLGPAYSWQKRFLQFLQLGCPARRWILKSPDHVYGLEELFAAFSDAMIIQTHRNPVDVLRSGSQLTELLQRLFARVGGRAELGEREARMLAEAMERIIRFRDGHPELAERFIDVKYGELVSDPLAVVRRIYQQLDIRLTELAAERMQRLAWTRSRYRRRHVSLTLADLGLDELSEARRFESYCSRFGIPFQAT